MSLRRNLSVHLQSSGCEWWHRLEISLAHQVGGGEQVGALPNQRNVQKGNFSRKDRCLNA